MLSERRISSLAECRDSIAGFIEELQQNWNTEDLRLADSLFTTLEDYFRLFHSFLIESAFTESEQWQGISGDIEAHDAYELVSQMRTFFDHFEERVFFLRDQQPILEEYSQPRFGRPPYMIPASQFEEMMELGYTYESMARILNVSSRTLRRYRQQYNLPRGRLFSELADDQLDTLVSEILQVRVLALLG